MVMKCVIRGEKLTATKAISDYIDSKIGKLDKYFKTDNVSATVVIKTKGLKQAIEVTIPYDRYVIRCEEVNDDLYAAIDLVVDKLERQIRKNKTKLKKQNTVNVEYFNFDYELDKEEVEDVKITKRKSIEMKPMDEEEAILELELLGHDFFIYRDMHTDSINVIYKRKDGNYGVIETN